MMWSDSRVNTEWWLYHLAQIDSSTCGLISLLIVQYANNYTGVKVVDDSALLPGLKLLGKLERLCCIRVPHQGFDGFRLLPIASCRGSKMLAAWGMNMLFSTNIHFAGVKYKSGDSRPTSGDCICDNHNYYRN